MFLDLDFGFGFLWELRFRRVFAFSSWGSVYFDILGEENYGGFLFRVVVFYFRIVFIFRIERDIWYFLWYMLMLICLVKERSLNRRRSWGGDVVYSFIR